MRRYRKRAHKAHERRAEAHGGDHGRNNGSSPIPPIIRCVAFQDGAEGAALHLGLLWYDCTNEQEFIEAMENVLRGYNEAEAWELKDCDLGKLIEEKDGQDDLNVNEVRHRHAGVVEGQIH